VGGLRDGFPTASGLRERRSSSGERRTNVVADNDWDEQGGYLRYATHYSDDRSPAGGRGASARPNCFRSTTLNWYESPDAADNDGSRPPQAVLWNKHTADVIRSMKKLFSGSPSPPDSVTPLVAAHHDLESNAEYFRTYWGTEIAPCSSPNQVDGRMHFARADYRHSLGLWRTSHQPDFTRLGKIFSNRSSQLPHHGRGDLIFLPTSIDPDLAFGDADVGRCRPSEPACNAVMGAGVYVRGRCAPVMARRGRLRPTKWRTVAYEQVRSPIRRSLI
jgi:hypothetical protein